VTIQVQEYRLLLSEALVLNPYFSQFDLVRRQLGLPLGDFPNQRTDTYRFNNESVILSPFVGWQFTPNDRFFALGFLEWDFDASGSSVVFTPNLTVFSPGGVSRPANLPATPVAAAIGNVGVSSQTFSPTGAALTSSPVASTALRNALGVPLAAQSGRIYQQDLMRVDVGTGYWLYRNHEANWITGVAPLVEVHYTTALNNADLIPFKPTTDSRTSIGNQANRVDITDLTLGVATEISNRSLLSIGGVIPLSSGDNKLFDYEITVQLNWRF
jgi:hypothetical protein